MTRPQKEPLRGLMPQEKERLTQLSRSASQPASQVMRAKILLAVASGKSYTAAAQTVGRRSGDAVAKLVARFNREGLAAVAPRHGGGPAEIYGSLERAKILETIQRVPQVGSEGTNHWSLSGLQRYLRSQGRMPHISTYTLRQVLHAEGWSWQKDRSWYRTGQAVRKRKSGRVIVSDPDTAAKKS